MKRAVSCCRAVAAAGGANFALRPSASSSCQLGEALVGFPLVRVRLPRSRDQKRFFVSKSQTVHTWIARFDYGQHSSSSNQSLYKQAHRLLDEVFSSSSSTTAVQTEQWMEAEECLWNLSNARTVESVDLTLLLLGKLLQARHQLLRSLRQGEAPSVEHDASPLSMNEAHVQYLTDRGLWHSILINWQQVSKEILSAARGKQSSSLSPQEDLTQLVSPTAILAMLDGWNELLAKTPISPASSHQPFECTTSKALSLIIDVAGRQGKRLADQPNRVMSDVVQHAEVAEMIFLRMLDQFNSIPNSFPPCASNLNMVLTLWAKTADVDRAWLLLKRAATVIHPDLRSYNAVLQAFAVTGNGAAAERVLNELCQPGIPVKPDVTSWNIVLAAWARSPDKTVAAERVEQLLVRMMMYGGNSRDDDNVHDDYGSSIAGLSRLKSAGPPVQFAVEPNLITFNTALSAWARAGEADTCARMLVEMQDLHKAGRLDKPPDVFSYATVMNAFAKAGQPEQAEALSNKMFEIYVQRGTVAMKPSIQIMTSILDAYSRQIFDAVTKKKDAEALYAVAKAQKMFQRMGVLNQFGFLNSGPDTAACNVMLTCYLRSCSASTFPRVNPGAEKADALLHEMKRVYAGSQGKDAIPDFRSYSIVIQAWLARPDGVSRATELLDELWGAQATGGLRMRPDSLSLHCIIVGFCRANRPDVANKLLMSVCETKKRDPSSMIEPRLASFGSVFGALCRSNLPSAPRTGQWLAYKMKELHSQGVLSQGPDHQIYRALASLWAFSNQAGSAKRAYTVLLEMRRRAADGEKSMQPDLITCNQVIFALSRGNSEPVFAERVLRLMQRDSVSGVSSVKPDIKSFNTALSAWARFDHPTSIDRADALFQEMQQLQRGGELACDAVTYNIMLHCLAMSSCREGAERAEVIVQKMKELSATGDLPFRLNSVSYGCLINAWIRVGVVARAESVLFKMYEEFVRGDAQMKPQIRHFAQVANALSKSTDGASGAKVQRVLDVKKLLYPDDVDDAPPIATSA